MLSGIPTSSSEVFSYLRKSVILGKAVFHTVCSSECAEDGRKYPRRRAMNWDQVEGKWKQVRGKVKEQWGKLTDDDIDVINGKRQQLVGKVQQRYGLEKEAAE